MAFGKLAEEYITSNPNRREATNAGYRMLQRRYLNDWETRPITEIGKTEIRERHARITKENGGPTANHVMRYVRAVCNYTHATYETLPENPVRYLSQTKAWNRETRRQTYIKSHQLSAWWKATHNLENTTARDFLLILLFTGMRKNEAARLMWKHIDFKDRTLNLPDTKNHDNLVLPLNSFVYDLLKRRREADPAGVFVFPGNNSVSGHFVEPKPALRRIRKESGVSFMLHDLRRTFITIAESLDIPYYALKKLLNHRTSGDVTARYLIIEPERLRGPSQRIADHILEVVSGKEENEESQHHS